jgi:hypothetical protein
MAGAVAIKLAAVVGDCYDSHRRCRDHPTMENSFRRIEGNRCVATRCEKLAVTFLGLADLAATIGWMTQEV